MFAKAPGIELTHVPYKGTAPAMQALMSGEISTGVPPNFPTAGRNKQ